MMAPAKPQIPVIKIFIEKIVVAKWKELFEFWEEAPLKTYLPRCRPSPFSSLRGGA
jgi:hypothetical protein